MALTAEEQKELEMLEAQFGSGAPKSNLTPEEAKELEMLEAQYGTEVQADVIKNEMPEGLTGRFVAKNLAATPEAAFNYLQKENPDFELKKDASGEIIARKRGEKEWGRLDPKGFDWRDLTDVAYDIPAGIAQGVATAAGGVAGAAFGGGVGAIPGAMGASALTGAGFEGVRQTLGDIAGVPKNYAPEELGYQAAFGAASPLLLGTGATGKQLLKAGVSQGTQRGLLGRGYDKVAGVVGPKLGAMVSGENSQVIKKAASMLDDLKRADSDPSISNQPLRSAAKTVNTTLKKQAANIGKELDAMRGMIDDMPAQEGIIAVGSEGIEQASKGSIPKADLVAPFENLIGNLSEGAAATPGQIADAQALKKVIESEFNGLPDMLTAKQVDTLRKRFKEQATKYSLNYDKIGTAQGMAGGAGSAIDKQIGIAFEQSRDVMNNKIIERLEAISPELAEKYSGLNASYSELKTLQKELQNKTKDPKSFSRFLRSGTMNDQDSELIEQTAKQTGVDLSDLALREQALKAFAKPSDTIRSLRGTSTSKTIPMSVVAGTAGYAAGQKLGISPFLSAMTGTLLGNSIASPAMMRRYMLMNRGIRQSIPGSGVLKYAPYSTMKVMDDPTK